MFPITCNAFGDIVAVVNILYSIYTSLDEARGSAAEFASFKREIWELRSDLHVLMRVAENSPTEDFRKQIVAEVNECCSVIYDALSCLTEFHVLGSDILAESNVRDFEARLSRTWKKLRWRFNKRKQAAELSVRLKERRSRLEFYLQVFNKFVQP